MKKGFTLIEIMVAIAILAIFMLLLGPLAGSLGRAHNKVRDINKIDAELSKSIEIIKRAVNSAKTPETGQAIEIVSGTAISGGIIEGDAVVIHAPNGTGSGDSYVYFGYEKEKTENGGVFEIGKIKISTGTTVALAKSGTKSTIIKRVVKEVDDKPVFRYGKHILRFDIKIKPDERDIYTRQISDAAVTRIDIE